MALPAIQTGDVSLKVSTSATSAAQGGTIGGTSFGNSGIGGDFLSAPASNMLKYAAFALVAVAVIYALMKKGS